jgi:hypothetical protein
VGGVADTRDAQEALDAAEAEIVSDCKVAGGDSGAVSACHGSDHVVESRSRRLHGAVVGDLVSGRWSRGAVSMQICRLKVCE